MYDDGWGSQTGVLLAKRLFCTLCPFSLSQFVFIAWPITAHPAHPLLAYTHWSLVTRLQPGELGRMSVGYGIDFCVLHCLDHTDSLHYRICYVLRHALSFCGLCGPPRALLDGNHGRTGVTIGTRS